VESRLLPFYLPCVTSQETGTPERLSEILAGFYERPGKSVGNRVNLRGFTAAFDLDFEPYPILESGNLDGSQKSGK
jgi:hypothetical protein